MRIDVLDDWAGVAESCADWSDLRRRAEVVFHGTALRGSELRAALRDSSILVPMRERTVIDAELLAAMPKLEMIALSGATTRHVDVVAVKARGITLCWSGAYHPEETAEFALGLMLAAEKGIARGTAAIEAGGFMQGTGLGRRLSGRTLGIIGLGQIGSRVAKMARAMDMKVLAWSRNLTPETALKFGALAVPLAQVMTQSDIVSIHVPLTDQTRGLISAHELMAMKPDALLVNTSRGPIVDEAALIAALEKGCIRAALDVFDAEPLPEDHPLRRLSNVTLTPHMGYATRECMEMFYGECVENITNWLDGQPSRVLQV